MHYVLTLFYFMSRQLYSNWFSRWPTYFSYGVGFSYDKKKKSNPSEFEGLFLNWSPTWFGFHFLFYWVRTVDLNTDWSMNLNEYKINTKTFLVQKLEPISWREWERKKSRFILANHGPARNAKQSQVRTEISKLCYPKKKVAFFSGSPQAEMPGMPAYYCVNVFRMIPSFTYLRYFGKMSRPRLTQQLLSIHMAWWANFNFAKPRFLRRKAFFSFIKLFNEKG